MSWKETSKCEFGICILGYISLYLDGILMWCHILLETIP